MDTDRGVTILFSVVFYMGICVVVGLWALRRTRSSADFFMAGRNLGVIVTGFAVFSSIMSGFGFVGGPGLVYHMGMSSLWMVISAPMGTCISFYLLGKRIRLLAELKESVSLPDVVAARYNSQLTRLLASLSILLGVMGYLGTQILAMATVLQDIIANTPIGRLSLEACVTVSFAVLVFYCVTGGIIASVYTDVVQGFIMVIAALLVLVAATTAVPDGFAGMSLTIGADDPEAISPLGVGGHAGMPLLVFPVHPGGLGPAARDHQADDEQAGGGCAPHPAHLGGGVLADRAPLAEHRPGHENSGACQAAIPNCPGSMPRRPNSCKPIPTRCWPAWSSRPCSPPSCPPPTAS